MAGADSEAVAGAVAAEATSAEAATEVAEVAATGWVAGWVSICRSSAAEADSALLAALLAVGTCHKWPGIPVG